MAGHLAGIGLKEQFAVPRTLEVASRPTGAYLFGEHSLRKSVQEFTVHYHKERHHQGLGNRLIMPDSAHMGTTGQIRRRERLGGMLNYYYREAA